MKQNLNRFIVKVEDVLENKLAKFDNSLDKFDEALERLQFAEDAAEVKYEEQESDSPTEIVTKLASVVLEFYKAVGSVNLYKGIYDIVRDEIKDSVTKEDLDAAVSSITNTILVKLSELKDYSEFTLDFQEELTNSIKTEIKELNVSRKEVQVVETPEQKEEPLEENQPLPVSTREESSTSTSEKEEKYDVIKAVEKVGRDVSVVDVKSEYSANKLDRVESLVLALSDMESSDNDIEAKAESDREEASALQVTDAIKENTSEGKKSTNKWAKAFDLVTGILKGLFAKISQNLPVIGLGLLIAFRFLQKAWDAIKNSAVGRIVKNIWDFLQKLGTFLWDKVVVPVVNFLLKGINMLLPDGWSIPELKTSEEKAQQREQEQAQIRENDKSEYARVYNTLKQLDAAEANYASDIVTAEREGEDKGYIHDNYLKTQATIIGESDRKYLESVYGKQEGTRMYVNPATAYRDRDYERERKYLEDRLNELKNTEGGAQAYQELGDYGASRSSVDEEALSSARADRVVRDMWAIDSNAGHWEGEGDDRRWVIDIPFEDYKAGKRNKPANVEATEETGVQISEGSQLQVGSASHGVESTIEEGIAVRQTEGQSEPINTESVSGYSYEDDSSMQEQQSSQGAVAVNSSNTDVRVTNINVTKSDNVIDYIA